MPVRAVSRHCTAAAVGPRAAGEGRRLRRDPVRIAVRIDAHGPELPAMPDREHHRLSSCLAQHAQRRSRRRHGYGACLHDDVAGFQRHQRCRTHDLDRYAVRPAQPQRLLALAGIGRVAGSYSSECPRGPRPRSGWRPRRATAAMASNAAGGTSSSCGLRWRESARVRHCASPAPGGSTPRVAPGRIPRAGPAPTAPPPRRAGRAAAAAAVRSASSAPG